jgi:hypothetical protein
MSTPQKRSQIEKTSQREYKLEGFAVTFLHNAEKKQVQINMGIRKDGVGLTRAVAQLSIAL